MKLIRGSQHLEAFQQGVVATIGNFDGVHLGHQHLIRILRKKADALHLPLVLILFEPQPREYFLKDKAPARLSSLRDKLAVLKNCQVDYVYCIHFNDRLAQTSSKDFATELLFSELQVKYLLVGQDFQFGKNREGDVNLLKSLGSQHGCVVDVCPDWCVLSEKISSTKIRTALSEGQLALAARYLGRDYNVCGRVIRGDGRGRLWGIPTANISLKPFTFALQGVFVVEARLGSRAVYGVANIGKRPTVDGTKNHLEVHLFDFDESIYGEFMRVFFLHKLRDEVKFTSVETLIEQIHHDIALGKAFFNHEQSTL